MEIHYLWIEKYANLENQGVNFSAKYIFDIELDSTQTGNLSGTITIKENPDYIENFFGYSNIKNVTAIIGRNGSGKTNILKFISQYLPKGKNTNMQNCILSYSIEENGIVNNYISMPDGWLGTLSIDDSTKKFIPVGYGLTAKGDNKFKTAIGNSEYMYYGFHIDFKNIINNNNTGLRDISTTALMKKSRDDRFGFNALHPVILNELSSIYDVSLLENSEVEKAFQLINSKNSNLIKFKIPDGLIIVVNDDNINRAYNNNTQIANAGEIISNLKDKFQNKPYTDLYISIFAGIVDHIRNTSRIYDVNYSLIYNQSEDPKAFLFRVVKEMKKIKVKDPIDSKLPPVNIFKVLSVNVMKLMDVLDKIIKKGLLISYNINLRYNAYVIPISDKTKTLLSNLYDNYKLVSGIFNFWNFNWRGLSSGEQSFLSFMARFYHEKYYAINKIRNEDLIIMIDEGDAGFHPEWQKEFFSNSISFLSSLFVDNNIQLIYTSNTPYITSDLTKNHIVFIDKNNNGKSIVLPKENNKINTFGANIHTLLADSFYIEGALLGSFAELKINEIITYLNSEENETIDLNVEKLIKQIGDQIIKSKLEQLYYEKKHFIRQIEFYEEKIMQLKQRNKKKNYNG